jgi:hypothetical protein
MKAATQTDLDNSKDSSDVHRGLEAHDRRIRSQEVLTMIFRTSRLAGGSADVTALTRARDGAVPMRTRRFARIVAVLATAIAAMLVVPASARAEATVARFSIPFEAGPGEVDDTCAGAGVVGILTGTGTFAGQQVDTDTGTRFRVVITFQYRVDFPDGSYLLASQREHSTSNENPLVGVVTFGGTLLERGTLYDAAGSVIGNEMFHAHWRTTLVDGNLTVEFDEGFIQCR